MDKDTDAAMSPSMQFLAWAPDILWSAHHVWLSPERGRARLSAGLLRLTAQLTSKQEAIYSVNKAAEWTSDNPNMLLRNVTAS